MSTRESDPAKGLNAAVAAVLNGERVAAGMTFDDLAADSGLHKRTLMRMMSTRERHIDLEVLELLADAFHTTPQRILDAATERLQRPQMHHGVDAAEADQARRAMTAAMTPRKPRAQPRSPRKSSRVAGRSTE